ncbi:MAG: hypothetical protein ABH951_02210, partial [Patescibacteria group bacterium]
RAKKQHIADLSANSEVDAAKPARNASSTADAGGEHTCKEGEKCEHENTAPPKPSPKGRAPSPSEKAGDEAKEEDLPEFNDEFVKALGPFKDVADFKLKLKDNIKLEKENQQKEKTRLKIVEDIIEKTEVDLPEILIEIELNKILYRMESDITQMGLKFEDYLKHLNKTIDDLKKEFHKDAEKKAKLGLILNEIAKKENVKADEEQVKKEVAMILEHYKDADPERAKIHAENVLTNEAVFKFLEEQK